MLHSYSFKNFQSFADRTEVSMVLNNKAPAHGWQTRSVAGTRLSLALGVMGANGAGKTIALKPLAFTAWFVAFSFDAPPTDDIPVLPHFAHTDTPTEFESEAEDVEGVLWRYVLHATPKKVVHEALYRKRERFNYVFTRDLNDSGDGYIIKQQGFGMPHAEALKVRANASLISTARQYGVEIAKHVADFHLVHNVNVRGRSTFAPEQVLRAADLFARAQPLREQMIGLLKSWDLGLSDVAIREVTRTKSDATASKVWVPFGVHEARNGAKHILNFHDESSGTQAAFVLLGRVLTALSEGGLAVIDELDSDLHPHMVEPVLDLFDNPATNPHKAQLIFSAHTPQVLTVLQKAQVLFIEKRSCESTAYRGDTIKGLRADDNLLAKYMAGALGAVPQV